jgi:ABC-type lipopolysaccharide export system ATPase subunit
MTSPLLEARHLVKRFHGITVVDDVSFVVQPGEVVGYLGPNGSGKTTTGRMLTGLVEPSGGCVLFNGRNVSDDPIDYRRRLGYVPEEPTLYPFLSAREQLRLVGQLRELPSAPMERKIDALLELFGMGGAAEQSIGAYSKDAVENPDHRGASARPDLLIFDEPDSGLDITTSLAPASGRYSRSNVPRRRPLHAPGDAHGGAATGDTGWLLLRPAVHVPQRPASCRDSRLHSSVNRTGNGVPGRRQECASWRPAERAHLRL